MKISKRGEYALRALIDFGIAHELGRPLMKIGELVEKERLPVKFLEQILTQLRGAGYIETKRGKAGGYFLAKPPKEISLGAVIRLIDGPLAPIACVSVTAYERCTCPDEAHCGLRMLMLDVRNAIARILDRYVLGDVVEITLRKMRRDGVPIPFMVEKLLQPKPAPVGIPAFEELNPLGGFLAALEELNTSAKPHARKPAGKAKAKAKARASK
jgi:Rrf2 family protein